MHLDYILLGIGSALWGMGSVWYAFESRPWLGIAFGGVGCILIGIAIKVMS